jgi:hypothetical protein
MSTLPTPRPGTLHLWFFALAALVVFDAAATALVVDSPAGEANPLLAALMAQIGVARALAVRLVVGIGLGALLLVLARRVAAARLGLAAVTAAHGLVACWHLAGPAVVA